MNYKIGVPGPFPPHPPYKAASNRQGCARQTVLTVSMCLF